MENSAATTIGNRIYTRRKQLHYTMEELGDKVGVTKSTINKWEKGTITNFNRSTLAKIADALDCSVQYLLGESEYIQDNSVSHSLSWKDYDSTLSKEIAHDMQSFNVLDKEVIYIVMNLLSSEIDFDETIKYYAQLDSDNKYYVNRFIELLYLNDDDDVVLSHIKSILRFMKIDSLRDLITYSQAVLDMKIDLSKDSK